MTDADWTGRVIDGRYVVEGLLGAGGMGLVLRARHQFTGGEVAVKVLRPELELHAEVQQRFLAEARAANEIGHPGIVQVIDAGKAPDGVLYLVMELLEGRPLRVAMARGELRGPDHRRILRALLDILAAAHASGFIHRDLKPDNVFLVDGDPGVKLLDFGIAKVVDATVRTATGATLGTPAYMAPEQLRDPSSVDARADLWAVGIIAYEMLAGRLPFQGKTTADLLIAVAAHDPDPIRAHVPNAPASLEAFFARALARDPRARFATAAELATAIDGLPLGDAPAPRPRPTAAALTPAASWVEDGSIAAPPTHGHAGAGAAATPAPFAPTRPPPVHAARAPDVAPPSRSHAGRWIAVAIAIVVIVAISVIAYVVRRRPAADDDPWATGHQGASVAPTAITTEPAGDPPDPDAVCREGCDAAATCSLAPTNCAATCLVNPALQRCVGIAATAGCHAAATCGLAMMCNAIPSGSSSCATALDCQVACGDDLACGCRCVVNLDPIQAVVLARVDICALNCLGDQLCMGQRCKMFADACSRQ